MRRWRNSAGRIVLSALALGAFLLLASIAPFTRRPNPPRSAPPPAPAAGSQRHSGAFTVNGVPMAQEENPVSQCDPFGWNPFAAGYCPGGCSLLSEQREATGASFTWFDKTTESLHSLALACDASGAGGRASHVSLGLPAARVISPSSRVGPIRPRTEPIPGLPGSVEVVHLDSGGMSLFVDRPSSASTALEELQLSLVAKGWRLAGGPKVKLPPDAPPSRVFVRGAEVYIATLEESGDDDLLPLLVSAYSRQGWLTEAPR